MKVEMIETFNFPPVIMFAVLTDIPHHVDWVDEPVELVSLSDGPAKLGTKWEQNADRSGKKLVTLNTCNIFEKNKKFGRKVHHGLGRSVGSDGHLARRIVQRTIAFRREDGHPP